MSKNPSTRRRGVGRYRFADDYRVPFPGATPASISHAAYVLTPLGRVYRDDGFLLRPSADKLRVKLNGKTLNEDLEMPGPTPAGVTGQEHSRGPLMFQGDHGPVAYRKIKITEKDLTGK